MEPYCPQKPNKKRYKMVTVTSQAEYEAAVAASEAEITLGATVPTLTVPTHSCTIVMPAGTGMTGAIVNSCQAGTASLYYGGAAPTLPTP